MAGTALFSARRALHTRLVAALPSVSVEIGEPAHSIYPVVWLGASKSSGPGGSQVPAGMRPTPHPRTETVSFDVVVEVRDVETGEAETALESIVVAIEGDIASAPTLGDLDGVLWLRVTEVSVSTQQVDHMVRALGVITVTMAGRIGG